MRTMNTSIVVAIALTLAGCATTPTKQPEPPAAPPPSPPPVPQVAEPPAPPTAGRGPGWQTPPRCAATYRGADAVRSNAATLKVNGTCAELIRSKEGLRLEAYSGPANVWLIGYGHAAGVSAGDVIDRADAERLLQEDLAQASGEVRKMLKVPVTANEFSALVCLAYNIGTGRLRRDSTMRAVNDRNYERAANEMTTLRRVSSSSPINAHLVERRQEECALFRTL